VADDISIAAADASGQRGQNIPLTITVGNSADTDGSETRSSVTMRNVPASVSFSAGVNNGDGTWTIPLTALSGLTARGSSNGQFNMTAAVSNTDKATFSDGTTQTDTRDFTDPFVLNITSDNTPPTITPAPPLVRQQGSPGFMSVIATVSDAETPAGNLVVTAANVSGIVLQNITNANGTITAFVAADCNAVLGNNSVVLEVRDAENATATGNLGVNVTANTPPVLSYATPPLVNLNGALTINPATGPIDNSTITSITVHSLTPPGFTGNITVQPTTGVVSVSNAAPGGTYSVTMRATDNCGAPRDASFTLTVGKIATRTVLDSTPSPSGIGHPVRFTARVRTVPAGLGPPTGNVAFYLGRTLLGTAPLNQGDATFTTDALCAGTHQIYAAYRGTDRFEPSESAILAQVVRANDFTIHTHAGNGVLDDPNTSGPATASPFNSVTALAMDRDGSLLIADEVSRVVSRVNARGEITRVAGSGSRSNNDSGDDGPALRANFRSPQGVAVDSKGNIYIADLAANRIRVVTPDGIIRHFAGHEQGAPGFSGDGGVATAARFRSPSRLAVDARDNLYVSDIGNHRVRRIDAVTKIITTVAGNGTAFIDSLDNRPATQVPVRGPVGLAFDRQGRLYIAVSGHHQIRRVDFTTGLITTVAGAGFAGDEGEGVPATQAALNSPQGVAVDAVGNIYIADFYNHRLRMVDAATGKISTIAGQGIAAAGFSGDGGGAKLAKISAPSDVVIAKDLAACGSGASALFLAEGGNRRVRKLDKGTAPNQPPPAQH
jgi:sugar lactone lactonase YvrE